MWSDAKLSNWEYRNILCGGWISVYGGRISDTVSINQKKKRQSS